MALPPTGHETGIDMGLRVLRITADGEAVDNPRHSRTAEHALRRAQRRVARRTQGSHHRCNAVQLLTRTHQQVQRQQVQRQRRDVHHTTARALLQQYDVIALARRRAGPQPGPQPSSRPAHQRCRLGSVSHHPHIRGSVRRHVGGGGAPRLHQPGR